MLEEIMLCILMSVLILLLIVGRANTNAYCSTYLGHRSSPQKNGYLLVLYKNARSFQRTGMYPVRVGISLSLSGRVYKEP
jgi:hypothetical protein